jgi:3-phosphoshikimate 1-carboxyvinyltransferase
LKQVDYISKPAVKVNGQIKVPGDKSISHRSIIFGSIAEGTSVIDGFLDGEDCLATLNAFKSMGVNIEGPHQQQVIIHGVGKYGLTQPKSVIDCGNSGTSIRLMAGLLAAQSFNSELTGDESLLRRPMLRVSKPLTEMGAEICTNEGKPPLRITGGKTLKGIDYSMPEASAQVKSCILLAGLYAKGQTIIRESGISRDHTERMLKTYSYPITIDKNTISVTSDGKCIGTKVQVPGDISSAAFFIVAGTIIPNAEIVIKNVGINPTRIGILHLLKEMGANINLVNICQFGEEPVADLHIKYAPLHGIHIDETLVPLAIDEFPILFIAAACAQGQTILRGAKELRYKESDRIGVMVEGLQRVGVQAEALEDGVIIQGGKINGGEVDSHGDHRIAMSFAIAGAVATNPIVVRNCANVATSFPNFIAVANALQIQIEEKIEHV